MNALYIIGGVALLTFGTRQTIIEVKVFTKGKQDKFGADIKLLGVGITCIICGIIIIWQHI